jgi:outer membrane receptor protein involved in Fe transport
MTLEWTRERWTMFGAVESRGETLDAEPSFGPSGGLYPNPGRTLVDLGGGFGPVDGIDVFGRLMNVFDRECEDVLGYPAPGRTAFIGVRLAVGR